jgi:hypothetical protein
LTLLLNIFKEFVLDILNLVDLDLESAEIFIRFPPVPETVIYLQVRHQLSDCTELATFDYGEEQIDTLILLKGFSVGFR